jgi:hypothetical protein
VTLSAEQVKDLMKSKKDEEKVEALEKRCVDWLKVPVEEDLNSILKRMA